MIVSDGNGNAVGVGVMRPAGGSDGRRRGDGAPVARARRVSVALGVLAVGAIVVWNGRHAVLAKVGQLLVAEDAVAPVDLLVVSGATPMAAALEVARLYHQGVSPTIAVPTWPVDPVEEELRTLKLLYHGTNGIVPEILDRRGVPASAVVRLPSTSDGTGSEEAAVAGYVTLHGLKSVMVITARDHSARVRWLLRRRLPATVDVRVRSPEEDDFVPGEWWRHRNQSREVAMEYLRWVNTIALGDAWARSE